MQCDLVGREPLLLLPWLPVESPCCFDPGRDTYHIGEMFHLVLLRCVPIILVLVIIIPPWLPWPVIGGWSTSSVLCLDWYQHGSIWIGNTTDHRLMVKVVMNWMNLTMILSLVDSPLRLCSVVTSSVQSLLIFTCKKCFQPMTCWSWYVIQYTTCSKWVLST